ncbi:tetratricopeptide repeat (TPR)-like superfamily protein [Actinidia rufa]|uniref:Tetratricopeptide repeat (TPR)-like superfamily protein n=1 Tax=Actinidia rufa TaxID=165716 RepID=A0A7J0DUS5_9ERIC|nr:tetratricopeptide repeat (TPR)-like superfamily protein [Actinidia rufa]
MVDIFVWNSMIKAYSSSQSPKISILMYNKMRVCENIAADNYTYPFVFRACANVCDVEKGREVHGVVLRRGFDSDRFLQSSLVNFYAVCGEIGSARKVFDEFPEKDVVFWNTMIMGYAREGMVFEALEVFEEMLEVGEVKPNEGTLLGLISVCTALKDLKMGREIHGYVKKEMGLSREVKLGAALIDLYSKCRCLDDARKVFEEMPEKNAVVWNSLICGYCQVGSLHEAIDLFRQMGNSNVKPDRFTISALLGVCAQTGAFSLGNWVRKFAENNGIWDAHIGTSLIDIACSIHGDIETAARRFSGVKAVREMMVEKGICKPPGCSMIEIDDVVHEFLVVDKSHYRSLEIYTVLDELSMKLKMAGYVPMLALDEENIESHPST